MDQTTIYVENKHPKTYNVGDTVYWYSIAAKSVRTGTVISISPDNKKYRVRLPKGGKFTIWLADNILFSTKTAAENAGNPKPKKKKKD